MNLSNPELVRAIDAIPGLRHAERQLEALKEKTRGLRLVTPDEARQAAVDEIVSATAGGSAFPRNAGERVHSAYVDAQKPYADALVLLAARKHLEDHIAHLRETENETALEALGESLAELLAEAAPYVATLGSVRSAEAAIEAGDEAAEAWRKSTVLVKRLVAIRNAQRDLLFPTTRDNGHLFDDHRRTVMDIHDAGHGEVAGFDPDEVPAFALAAVRSRRFDVPYLAWLVTVGTAHVPTTWAALEEGAALLAGKRTYTDDGPVWVDPQTVSIIPTPPAPKRHGFEQSPDIALR